MNAEIRRTKARLLEEVPKLQRLAMKKVKSLISAQLLASGSMPPKFAVPIIVLACFVIALICLMMHFTKNVTVFWTLAMMNMCCSLYQT